MKNKKIANIITCRMGSTRLPNKAILLLNNIPSIQRCLLNSLKIRSSQLTILASSTNPKDEILKDYIFDDIKFFRGSEEDPIERIINICDLYDIDVVVRITGDSPLISYEQMDYLISSHLRLNANFSFIEGSPLGTKGEVINADSLRKLKDKINTDKCEYISLFFKNNPDYFRLNKEVALRDYIYPSWRLNLDTINDYELLCNIFEGLNIGFESVALSKVIKFLLENEYLLNINSNITPVYVKNKEELYERTRIKN